MLSLIIYFIPTSFPGGTSGNESICQCRRHELDPWVGKIWKRKWKPTSVFLAWKIPRTEEPGGLQSTGVAKSWTWLSDHAQQQQVAYVDVAYFKMLWNYKQSFRYKQELIGAEDCLQHITEDDTVPVCGNPIIATHFSTCHQSLTRLRILCSLYCRLSI